MNEIIAEALKLAGTIFGQKRDENGTKWTDRATNAQLDLANELAKGQLQDNAKVEKLSREIAIIIKAATLEQVIASNPKP